MTYYMAADDSPAHARLLEPPFRVIEHFPGVCVFIEFDEAGLDLLREVRLSDGRPYFWLWDKQRWLYRVTRTDMERQPKKNKPGQTRRWLRSVRKRVRWIKKDKKICAGVTEPSFIPKGRAPLFFRNKRYIYIRPGHEYPFRYTLRSPKGEGGLPLVIYLHGGGAGGTNGLKPLLQRCGLMFTKGNLKYHLLVPQQGLGNVYGDEFSEAMGEVIESIPCVDHSRIYITGVSMGGCGAVIECRRHPERYAAAVPAVAMLRNLSREAGTYNAMEAPLDAAAYDTLAQTPMWLGYSGMEQKMNEPLYEALKERGADVRRTHIKLRGWFGHAVSPFVFSLTKPWAKWMFEKRTPRLPPVEEAPASGG